MRQVVAKPRSKRSSERYTPPSHRLPPSQKEHITLKFSNRDQKSASKAPPRATADHGRPALDKGGHCENLKTHIQLTARAEAAPHKATMNNAISAIAKTHLSPTKADLRAQASTGEFLHDDDTLFFGKYPKMDPDLRLRWLVARAVIRRAVHDILAAQDTLNGQKVDLYSITLQDGEDEPLQCCRNAGTVMDAIGASDEEILIVRDNLNPRAAGPGWIMLVHGNDGWDVLADHADNPTMTGLLAQADALAEELS